MKKDALREKKGNKSIYRFFWCTGYCLNIKNAGKVLNRLDWGFARYDFWGFVGFYLLLIVDSWFGGENLQFFQQNFQPFERFGFKNLGKTSLNKDQKSKFFSLLLKRNTSNINLQQKLDSIRFFNSSKVDWYHGGFQNVHFLAKMQKKLSRSTFNWITFYFAYKILFKSLPS